MDIDLIDAQCIEQILYKVVEAAEMAGNDEDEGSL